MKTPLPPVGQAKVSLVVAQVAMPTGTPLRQLKGGVTGSNLGSPAVNTQVVVVAIPPKSLTGLTARVKVYVFMKHWPPVRTVATDRRTFVPSLNPATAPWYIDDHDSVGKWKVVQIIPSLSCSELQGAGFFGDNESGYFGHDAWGAQGFDTKLEAQVDGVVWTKCPAAENPSSEPGNSAG